MKRETIIAIIIGLIWLFLAAISFLYVPLPPRGEKIEQISLKIKIYLVNAEGLPLHISGNITIYDAGTLRICEKGNFTQGQYLTRNPYKSGSKLKISVSLDNKTFNTTRTLPEPKQFVPPVTIPPGWYPPEHYLPDYFIITVVIPEGY